LKEATAYFLGLLFDRENRGSIFLRNLGKLEPGCIVSHPRSHYSPQIMLYILVYPEEVYLQGYNAV
jgi:hypothetical protein